MARTVRKFCSEFACYSNCAHRVCLLNDLDGSFRWTYVTREFEYERDRDIVLPRNFTDPLPRLETEHDESSHHYSLYLGYRCC